MIDIFQDRATVRAQKIALLKEKLTLRRQERKDWQRQAGELDAAGYANFYFMWGIDADSEEPIRQMEQNYLARLAPDEHRDFVQRMGDMKRAKVKADYRAAAAGENIAEIRAELSRLRWVSRKEAVRGAVDRIFHLH